MIRKKRILPFLLKMDENMHRGNPEIGDMHFIIRVLFLTLIDVSVKWAQNQKNFHPLTVVIMSKKMIINKLINESSK